MPKTRIFDRHAYEFFAGKAADGEPVRTAELSRKQPVFVDAANGVGWNLSISYNAGLRRYIQCTQHTENAAGNLGIFDAPEP